MGFNQSDIVIYCQICSVIVHLAKIKLKYSHIFQKQLVRDIPVHTAGDILTRHTFDYFQI